MTGSMNLLLAALEAGPVAGIAIAALVVGAAIGLIAYRLYSQNKIGLAKREAARILEEAGLEAKAIRKDGLLEAKEQQNKLRAEFERETKERRADWQRTENRLLQKENAIDRKEDNLNKKEDALDKKLAEVEKAQKSVEEHRERLKAIEAELNNSQEIMQRELERVAGMTREEASAELKDALLDEVKRGAAAEAKAIEAEAKENAVREAQNIIATAIQRCAADHATENTVSVVALPNDEMKGRIIGRMGRNIRALESATGVDLIIDDTPDVITLSSFDPVRREVARLALHQLVTDGRIHPARIEEVVEKVRKQLDDEIMEIGKRTCIDLGIHGLHAELVKLVGRMKYRSSYGQNLLQHSREVANICATMAAELGLNPKLAKRAGLLHDIGKVSEEDSELPHAILGMKLAEKYKEKPEVCNAIGAHHEEVEMLSLISPIVLVGDAISGARPGARREVIESYIKRLKDMEAIALSYPGVTKTYAIQAGRELRVIVGADQVSDAESEMLSNEIARKIQNEMVYPGQVKITVIRETRSVAFAK